MVAVFDGEKLVTRFACAECKDEGLVKIMAPWGEGFHDYCTCPAGFARMVEETEEDSQEEA